jgi:hypothetical protein
VLEQLAARDVAAQDGRGQYVSGLQGDVGHGVHIIRRPWGLRTGSGQSLYLAPTFGVVAQVNHPTSRKNAWVWAMRPVSDLGSPVHRM